MRHVRWAGFDMDECLGALYPLYVYCEQLMEEIEDESTRNGFYMDMIDKISHESFFNDTTNIWLFRPDFKKVLQLLLNAYQYGQITGCFILSNNGSSSLVNTARLILNSAIAKLSNYQVTDLFKESWYAYSPCRKGSMVKSWTVIQNCLRSANLPTMHNPKTDLIFFDDKEHPSLKRELEHNYIQVTPYFNYTPHINVSRLLDPIFEKYQIQRSVKSKIKRMSENIEYEDLQLRFTDTPNSSEESYSLKNPSIKIRQQIHEFIDPLTRFIMNSPNTKIRRNSVQKTIRNQKLTLKNSQKIVQKSIKNSKQRKNIWKRY